MSCLDMAPACPVIAPVRLQNRCPPQQAPGSQVGTQSPLVCTLQPMVCQECCLTAFVMGPERGRQSHSCKEGPQVSVAGRERSKDSRVLPEGIGVEAGPLSPNIGLGTLGSGWEGPERQLGVSRPNSQGEESSPGPCCSALTLVPRGNTGTFMASQKGLWGSQSGF